MEDNKNNKIARFASILYAPELPALYNQGLTDYEILVRIATVINNNAAIMDDWYKLEIELEKALADIDAKIAEGIIEVLNEWHESGKLEEMLAPFIDEYLDEYTDKISEDLRTFENDLYTNPRNSIIDCERVFRVLKQNGNYMFNQPDHTVPADDTRTAHYTSSQGACHYTDLNGNERIAIIYVCNDGTPFQMNNNGVIEVYDKYGEVIRTRTFTASEIGHGQYIAYHNGYFYFGGEITGDPESNHKLRYINEDLSGTVQYTLITNLTRINGISAYNGRVWLSCALSTEINVSELQFESDNITPKNAVINSLVMNPPYIINTQGTNRSNTIFSGGFSVTEKYYYFGTYKPNGVLQCKRNFEIENDELVEKRFTPNWYFSLPELVCSDYFLFGELEALTVHDNGDIWFFSTQHLNTKAACMHEITQVFKQNLFNNLYIPSKGAQAYTGRTNIYADNTAANTNKNPYGTENDAFKTVDEAVWWFNNYPKVNYGRFFLRGNHPYTVWCMGKSYRFDGDAAYQNYSDRPHATLTTSDRINLTMLGNVMCWGGNVEFYNCALYSTLHYLTSGYSDQKEHCLYADGSRLILVNSGASGVNNPNIKGGFYLRNCGCDFNYNNSLANSVAFSQRWFVNNFSNNKRYYFSLGNCSVNAHGDFSRTQNGYNSSGTAADIAESNVFNTV